MMNEIGRIRAIFIYPVKSMSGIAIDPAQLGWHGIEGDRRLAFRRLADAGGFPWLTAGRLPELLLYRPLQSDGSNHAAPPTHVLSPTGSTFELRSAALQEDIARRHGGGIELMQLDHGIFDAASVSIITSATIQGIERAVGMPVDQRRFRPNIVVETESSEPFGEDAWVSKTLLFGTDESGASLTVTMRDERCSMINLDPDTAQPDARVLKAVVRMNANHAGVYGAVVQAGEIRVGDPVRFKST